MADFDGPIYTITPGTYDADGQILKAVKWLNVPTWTPISLGSNTTGTPSGQDINGYGYSQSG